MLYHHRFLIRLCVFYFFSALVNSILPTAIEQYLKEANFSTTEMLILKKLLEQDALTLRELASKTGKSTGVLDIAMKKLLRKGIVERTVINGTLRYCIESLDAVSAWVKHDMEEKQQDLQRKHESFEYFLASLKVDKKRPDMQHFTGQDGLQSAYRALLESGEELLTVTPILYRAEDDPLREFRVEYFKKRQSKKIFQRIIAPDSPLARRFHARDMFEYRRTALLPSSDFSIGFERTVAGDTVACFNFQDETACLLTYPALAEGEKATFENLWSHALSRESGKEARPLTQHLDKTRSSVPLSTRLASRVRQFLLSQASIVTFAAFGLITIAVAVGLSKHSERISLARMQDHIIAVASLGALHIDPADIRAVDGPEDVGTPAYAKLVAALNLIRRNDDAIRYAYIFRQTDDPSKLAFVADADSIDPTAQLDLDKNGSIGPEDELSYPGDLYDISDQPHMREGFERPIVDAVPVEDQWGQFVSGLAPIYDENGNVIAALGIDVLADRIDDLSPSIPLIIFILGLLFLIISIIRFCLANKSLMLDVWTVVKMRLRLIVLAILFVVLAVVGIVQLYQWHVHQLRIEEMGKRLMAIAVTAVDDFDPADLKQLHWARDMKTDAYQRVFLQLNEIRNNNPEITYAYIMRPTETENLFIFVADADSNWSLPHYSQSNLEKFSELSESDEGVAPGVYYQDSSDGLEINRPSFSIINDQWGHLMTGSAPILSEGKVVALLAFDFDISDK